MVKTNFTQNNIVHFVLTYLILNTMQEIIVYKIMCDIIYNQVISKPKNLNQLLLVVRSKRVNNKH